MVAVGAIGDVVQLFETALHTVVTIEAVNISFTVRAPVQPCVFFHVRPDHFGERRVP